MLILKCCIWDNFISWFQIKLWLLLDICEKTKCSFAMSVSVQRVLEKHTSAHTGKSKRPVKLAHWANMCFSVWCDGFFCAESPAFWVDYPSSSMHAGCRTALVMFSDMLKLCCMRGRPLSILFISLFFPSYLLSSIIDCSHCTNFICWLWIMNETRSGGAFSSPLVWYPISRLQCICAICDRSLGFPTTCATKWRDAAKETSPGLKHDSVEIGKMNPFDGLIRIIGTFMSKHQVYGNVTSTHFETVEVLCGTEPCDLRWMHDSYYSNLTLCKHYHTLHTVPCMHSCTFKCTCKPTCTVPWHSEMCSFDAMWCMFSLPPLHRSMDFKAVSNTLNPDYY